MLSLTRPALIAAGAAGLLWTAKVAVITARDGSFDPLESYVFIGGLLAIVAASVLVPLSVTRGLAGLRRAAAVVAGAVLLFAATVALEAAGKALVGGPYSGGNLGIEQEAGILFAGLGWLALAAAAARARPSATAA